MAKETKRAWNRPELIVLVRSGPEEAVLAACKWYGLTTSDNSEVAGCWHGVYNNCETVCSLTSSS